MFLKRVKVLFCKNVLRRYFRMRARFCVCPKKKIRYHRQTYFSSPPFVPSFLSLSLSHFHSLTLSLTHMLALTVHANFPCLSLSPTHIQFAILVRRSFLPSSSLALALTTWSLSAVELTHTHCLLQNWFACSLSLSLSLHILSLSFAHPLSSCTLSYPLSNSFSATW